MKSVLARLIRFAERITAALESGTWRSGPKWPVAVVRQHFAADCGPACLSMIAGYFDIDRSVRDLNRAMGVTQLGWGARDLLRAGEQAGLSGKALRIESLTDLEHLDRPVILHWRFSHYVVLESATRGGAWIVDPAVGRRWIRTEEMDRAMTGVVLWFERRAGIATNPAPTATPRRVWRLIYDLVRQTRIVLPLLLVATALQAIALFPALVAGAAFGHLAQGEQEWLLVLIVAVGFFAVAHHYLGLVKGNLLTALKARIHHHLGDTLFERLLWGRFDQLQLRSHADTVARLTAAESLRETLATSGAGATFEALLAGIGTVLAAALLPQFTLPMLAFLALGAAIQAQLARHRHRRMAPAFTAQAISRGLSSQAVTGAETIRAMGGQEWVSSRWSDAFSVDIARSSELSRAEVKVSAFQETFMLTGGLVCAVAVSSAVAYGLISLPHALTIYTLLLLLLGSSGRLLAHLNALTHTSFQAERVLDLLDVTSALPPTTGDGWTLDAPGHLSVNDLTFKYFPNAPLAVNGVSIDVPAGNLAVILGASGSGKSTLLSLLAGIHLPERGAPLINRRSISTIDRRRSRRPLILVPQFPYLFNGTVRENIALGLPDADLGEIVDAAREACIHAEIMALPMGYETMLGDNGTGLSGGQRQRISLARAFLCKPGVLLLDESTSALDPELELAVFENIRRAQTTTLLATHRAHMATHADQVVIMTAGQTTFQGRPDPTMKIPYSFPIAEMTQ